MTDEKNGFASYTAEHHALLFGLIAKSAHETFGAAAEPVLTEAVVRYGNQRGRRMRLRAERDGLPICMAAYLLYREYRLAPGQFCSDTSWNERGDMRDSAVKCPWAETWHRYGLAGYAAVYCRHIDAALGRGFGEHIRIETRSNLTDGAPHCEIWFRDAARTEGVSPAGLDLDRRARLPWEYHLAHLYTVCADTLEESVGQAKAREVLDRASGWYCQATGDEAGTSFLDLCGLDFDTIGNDRQ